MRSIGALRDRVALDCPAPVADGSGGVEHGWVEVGQCSAAFRYLRGGETVQSARLDGRQPVVVTVHASALTRGITTDMRLRDLRRALPGDRPDIAGLPMNIRAVVETEDRAWIEITAEIGVAT